jgi:NADPH:quinone reductase-like Zn-dependent oxidoreductase
MNRSVRIHEFGGPEALRLEDVVVGEPGAGEVRLRIHAIGLNRTDDIANAHRFTEAGEQIGKIVVTV